MTEGMGKFARPGTFSSCQVLTSHHLPCHTLSSTFCTSAHLQSYLNSSSAFQLQKFCTHPTTCHVIPCISICFDVFICICICVDIYICIYRMRASLQGRGPSKLGRSSHPTTCHVIPLHPHSAHLHICHLPILRVCTTIWSGIRSSYNSNALQFLIGPAMSYPTLALLRIHILHICHLPIFRICTPLCYLKWN